MSSTIYRLDFANGKSYIGKARCPFSRFLAHKRDSRRFDTILYRAWRKYGTPTLVIIAYVEDDELNATEQRAIKVYKTYSPDGYNMTLGGDGGFTRLSRLFTPQHCAAISKAKKGVPGPKQSLATKEKRRLKLIGRPRPDVAKQRKGMKYPAKWRAAISAGVRGKKRTPEQCARIKLVLSNPAVRQRISAGVRKYYTSRRENAVAITAVYTLVREGGQTHLE